MIVYLIRHGQTDANIKGIYQGNMDVSLNKKGEEQAKLIAWRLRDYPFDALYSSHLKRAIDTTSAICEYHDLTPVVKQNLEEISFGEWQGKTRDEVKKQYADFIQERKDKNDRYVTAVPGGESFVDFHKRAIEALDEILQDAKGEHVAVVCHGGIIKAVVGYILDIDMDKQLSFDVYNTSITTIKYDAVRDRLKLIALNDTAHL